MIRSAAQQKSSTPAPCPSTHSDPPEVAVEWSINNISQTSFICNPLLSSHAAQIRTNNLQIKCSPQQHHRLRLTSAGRATVAPEASPEEHPENSVSIGTALANGAFRAVFSSKNKNNKRQQAGRMRRRVNTSPETITKRRSCPDVLTGQRTRQGTGEEQNSAAASSHSNTCSHCCRTGASSLLIRSSREEKPGRRPRKQSQRRREPDGSWRRWRRAGRRRSLSTSRCGTRRRKKKMKPSEQAG